MGRSTETVRTTLKDVRSASIPTGRSSRRRRARSNDEAKGQIYRLYRRGVSVEVLAGQFGRTRSSIYRVINEMRARRILSVKLEYMPHPSFDDPAARAEILGPMPDAARRQDPAADQGPQGAAPLPGRASTRVPLLSREQEVHLFRKMNYLKYLANQLREPDRARPARGPPTSTRSSGSRKRRWRSRTRSSAPTSAWSSRSPSGTSARRTTSSSWSPTATCRLIRAVEKFDFARGNKFSTYASWAIMKNFARTIPEENYRRDRFVTGHEEMFEAAADTRTDEHEYETAQKRNQEAVKGMLGRLDDRERRIIVSRYGINGASEQTLEQLGRELGITKERVRQIESRAQEKLRKIAIEEKLDLPML